VSALVLAAGAAAAQTGDATWPDRPVRLIVPFPAGSSTDIVSRILAQRLGARLGQQVVIDNRVGASGNLGADAVAKAAPDGYTLLMSSAGILTANPHLYAQMPFDAATAFIPVSNVAQMNMLLVVHPKVPAQNLKEFVALAKAKPGTINYGSAGIGTSTHLAGAYFALKTGIEIVHVPYTVSAAIIADLLGGRIQASFVPLAFVLPLLQDGRLRALAVAAETPVTNSISIPTAQSQGFDYQYGTWYGMLAAGKTPKPVLTTLTQAMAEASKDPELIAKIRVQGIEPRDIGLDRFDAHVRAEMARLDPVLKTVAEKR
jgi:tripartite-type tricarboxylate transporter receptor subunit TctC